MRFFSVLLLIAPLAIAAPLRKAHYDTNAYPKDWKRQDASPDAAHPQDWKRDLDSENNAAHPQSWKRDEDAPPVHDWKRDDEADPHARPGPKPWKRDSTGDASNNAWPGAGPKDWKRQDASNVFPAKH